MSDIYFDRYLLEYELLILRLACVFSICIFGLFISSQLTDSILSKNLQNFSHPNLRLFDTNEDYACGLSIKQTPANVMIFGMMIG